MTPPRVTGIGGVFFKAREPASLGAWYRSHLGVDVQEGGWAIFKWRDHQDPARPGTTIASRTSTLSSPRSGARA